MAPVLPRRKKIERVKTAYVTDWNWVIRLNRYRVVNKECSPHKHTQSQDSVLGKRQGKNVFQLALLRGHFEVAEMTGSGHEMY